MSHNQKPIADEKSEAAAGSDKYTVPTCDLTKLSEEEKIWRNSLQAGDLVDVIKIDENFDLKGWARGKIEAIVSGFGCDG